MTNVEEVIECLGSTIHNAEWANKITTSCDVGFLKEIYAMLKSQEPRLLSVEIVVGYVVLKRDATLWFEFRNGIKEMNTKDIVYNDFLCDEDFPTLADPNLEWEDGGKRDGVIIAEYNDTFRCWTSCPSEEQRKAEEWK